MIIRLLGAHNMESINIRPACALIDDIIALDAGGLTAGLTLQEQTGIKAILLTHYHYDHIKDIIMVGANFHDNEGTIVLYGTQTVREAIEYLFNFPGKLYKNLLEHPPENPVIKFRIIEPLKEFEILGYKILPVPVKHSVPTVGFYITSPAGKKLFYTGDTGPGLNDCWRLISPDLLIIENTVSDSYIHQNHELHHLSPSLLKTELRAFYKIKGYLPTVITTHMFPNREEEIERTLGLKEMSAELNTTIMLGYEGLEITI